jgi:hypothetical protein
MIFFTRELYQGVQPKSGWQRRAKREWHRRLKACIQYEEVIRPLLPSSVVQFLRKSLHDAEVESVSQRSGKFILILDARPCASGSYRGHRVRITFGGVRRRVRARGLVGQWLLYREAHLCSRAKFSMHLLFTESELEIEADELSIEKFRPWPNESPEPTAAALSVFDLCRRYDGLGLRRGASPSGSGSALRWA